MSLSKFKLLQPTMIKFSNSYNIPKNLRNQYVINFNAMGIDWFTENFIMLETGKGFLVQENPVWDKHTKAEPIKFLLEDFDSDKFDIPRVYIVIKPEYVKDDSLIFDFISQSLSNNVIYGTGIKNMKPGIDYYVNETLYKYLTRTEDSLGNILHPQIPTTSDIVLPNYLGIDGDINHEYFDELSDNESDYMNLTYFSQKNKAMSYGYTDNQLDNICATFCQTILDLTTISDEMMLEPKNQAYKACIEYFANNRVDCCTQLLDLILGSSWGVANTAISQSILGSCGKCSSSLSSTDTTNQKSCKELYSEAMDSIFKAMLSDPDFYEDWMSNEIGDGFEANGCLIESIKDLLEAFKERNANKGSLSSTSKNCGCPRINRTSGRAKGEFENFDNYEDMLNYLCEGTMSQNKNKARLYGESFAEDLLSRCS